MTKITLKEQQKFFKDFGEKVKKEDEIPYLKGEKFNIFSILDLETKENKTHSNFLVSLLNPKGEHGLESIFLNLFYDMLLAKEITDEKKEIIKLLKKENVIVKTEEYIGEINNDPNNPKGGRVDITITVTNGKIWIENKINAGDQPDQIARYCNNHSDEKKVVLYLTLNDGSEASKGSTGSMKVGKDYFLLSYESDINNWLMKCQKEASDIPILRETIKQYRILILKLTGQLVSQTMNNEIIDLILENETNYKVAESIKACFDEAKKNRYRHIIDKIGQLLFSLHNISIDVDRSNRGTYGDGFFIVIDKINIDDLEIGINIQMIDNCFFFCIAEKGKVRKTGKIYNGTRLDKISNYLCNNLRSKYQSIAGKGGYTIAGDIKFREKFSKELQFSTENATEIDNFCKSLVDQLVDAINISKIKEYKNN